MINPHFVIDKASRMCICGNYHGASITCQDIMDDLLELDGLHATRIKLVMESLKVECEASS